jgi:hypothetical protein
MVAAAVAAMGAGADARAQEAPAARVGEDLFGSYALEGHGQGVQVRYEIEGLLPGGAPVLDLGLPEALARFESGPTGYGVASLAYPGGVIVNLPSLAAQGGAGDGVPPYPIQSEAFFPSGPTEADGSQPGGTSQRVVTDELGVDSLATFPTTDASPAVRIGTVLTHARTRIEGATAVSRTRVVAEDVSVLGGVLTLDAVTTDLVAVHNGSSGTTSGGTRVTGLRFLGLDAAFTDEGLVLEEAPPVEGPGAPLGDILDPAVPAAASGLSPVEQALADALRQARPQLDEVLAMAGVRVWLAEPQSTVSDAGAATRRAAGLVVELSYKGREQAALADLLAAVPEELKPSIGPIANPVGFLAENHISTVGLSPASVSSLATPPFPAIDVPLPEIPAPPAPSAFDAGFTTPPSDGFTTPTPDLPAPDAQGDEALAPIDDVTSPFEHALPAGLVVAALLLSPLFGAASTKLADDVLAPVSTGCPTGHDTPPPARPT